MTTIKYTIRETIEQAIIARNNDVSFQLAYGKFMLAWTSVESELYNVLVAYTGVDDGVARAIFSGTRAGTMIEFIRGIAHNTEMKADRFSDLEHVFPQIVTINKVRDHLAHHAADNVYAYVPETPENRVITNARRVSRYGKERTDIIGVNTLEAMTHDLHGILNHLNMHYGPRTGPFRPWRENSPDDPPTTWLYKSPQPETPRRGSPLNPHKRETPQKSSRKKS